MFSIHSTELILIFIVALIVIGPERLPGAVKTAGLWIGRFRRSFYRVKSEIERELNADEIRRQLHNESVLADIDQAKSDLEEAAQDTKESVNKIVNSSNFDPGASTATAAQAEKDGIESELSDVKEAVEEVGQALYGGGKNPKLAQEEAVATSEPDSDAEAKKADNGIG